MNLTLQVVLTGLAAGSVCDYAFTVPAPLLSVGGTADSESKPGKRNTGIVWQGFSSGHRLLGAQASLKTSAQSAASRSPSSSSVAAARPWFAWSTSESIVVDAPLSVRGTVTPDGRPPVPVDVVPARAARSRRRSPCAVAVHRSCRCESSSSDRKRPSPPHGSSPPRVIR